MQRKRCSRTNKQNPRIMLLVLRASVCCLAFTIASVWTFDKIGVWQFSEVRKSLPAADVTVASLVACSTYCSQMLGTGPFSLLHEPGTGRCQCNTARDYRPEDPSLDVIQYGEMIKGYTVEETNGVSRTIVFPYHQDCLSLYDAMYRTDGVYVIQPVGGATTDTWCDMTNGGWTVILRRSDGSENFYRPWSDYVNGFGNKQGEYWLGLENMHKLTNAGTQLRIEMEAYPDVTPTSLTANYGIFSVGNSAVLYRLSLSGFSGTCSNSLIFENGMFFTTYDRDNDFESSYNCAFLFKGGWWHNECQQGQLTGTYYRQGEFPDVSNPNVVPGFASGIHWYDCWQAYHPLKTAVMKIRRI